LVEAVRTDNGWLEYRLRAVQDALLDQRALTVEGTTAVDRVKIVLLEKDEALATANDELQKACAALTPQWRRRRPPLPQRRLSSNKTAPP
jgi:hypothetical protein